MAKEERQETTWGMTNCSEKDIEDLPRKAEGSKYQKYDLGIDFKPEHKEAIEAAMTSSGWDIVSSSSTHSRFRFE